MWWPSLRRCATDQRPARQVASFSHARTVPFAPPQAIRQAVKHKERSLASGDEEAEVQAFLAEPGWEFAQDGAGAGDGGEGGEAR